MVELFTCNGSRMCYDSFLDEERIKQFSLFLDKCLPADSMDSDTKRNFYRMVRDG